MHTAVVIKIHFINFFQQLQNAIRAKGSKTKNNLDLTFLSYIVYRNWNSSSSTSLTLHVL